MASLSKTPPFLHSVGANPSFSSHVCPLVLSFRFSQNASLFHTRLSAVKTGAGDSDNLIRKPNLFRKPLISRQSDVAGTLDEQHDRRRKTDYLQEDAEEDRNLVDWEDQILEETVPLVGFVRMILHSGEYESGDRLIPEHERTILEKLLPFHPNAEKKIGCGIDYITIGYHPNFERSRCLFIARKDGELVDFSYWKCIKGLIKKNYPLYADSFILRHFRNKQNLWS